MPYQSRWTFTPHHVSIPTFLFAQAQSHNIDENRKIFIDASRPETHFWTLASYRTWSKRFAAGLLKAGFKPGDRLMCFSGNSIFTPIVVMGTIMAGGMFNSANPAFTVREATYQMKDSQPTFILAASNCLQRAIDAAATLEFPRERILLFEDIEITPDGPPVAMYDSPHWTNLIATAKEGGNFQWEELDTRAKADRTAILGYSSGTTGLPKGVEITHFQTVTNMLQVQQSMFSDTSVKERRSLCALPFYHGLGLTYYCLAGPAYGLQVYVMERYNADRMLQHIEQYSITELLLVPAIVLALAKHPGAQSGRYDLSSVTKVFAGAAPLGKEVSQQFEDLWLGKLRVQQGWGMTEAPTICLAWDERDKPKTTSSSVGELLAGLEARVVDENEQDIEGTGKPGELWIRGPNILKSYWKNPKATAETKTSDGWLKTGDIAYVDNDGKWYIVDRKKELIKVRGNQVAPAELESLLLEHPQILDAAVIGLRTPEGDEEPRAYVVPRDRRMLSPDDVATFIRRRVVKQKQLCGGVVFVEAIPKTPAGKILRRLLREQALQEVGRSVKL